jgi:hypothetical protein
MKRRRRKHQLSSLMIWLFTFNYKISSKINNCVLHFIQNRKRTASKCWTVILILGCKLENRYGWSLKKIRNDTQYLQNMYLTCVPAGPPRELLGPRAKRKLAPSSNSPNNDTQTKFTTACHRQWIDELWFTKQLCLFVWTLNYNDLVHLLNSWAPGRRPGWLPPLSGPGCLYNIKLDIWLSVCDSYQKWPS